MAANCPPIKIQQFDDNGDPAVGYKLHTYITGTTTNKATYTDAAGTTPNANPVVLDARGEATVFLIAGEQYRFVLKTAADVTIWTQDGVSASVHTAGDGITFTNGVISLSSSTAGNGLTYTAGVLAIDPTVVAPHKWKLKTGTTSRASTTTMTADPHLTMTVVNNKRYAVRGLLISSENNPGGGDLKWSLGGSTNDTIVVTAVMSDDTVSSVSYLGGTDVQATSPALTRYISFSGTLTTTATTLSVDWAQNVSSANATTLFLDSYFEAVQLN